ncbi:MAG: site-2 protease family protein [Rhodospirillales bacterium]|nr:site-2 protease family protein [Rhodospirillales bacterium]
MFLYRVRLFSLFGFAVSVDASWLVLAALVSWSLAAAVFPALHPGFTQATYWAMGIAATLGLFSSIVFHETAHSVVARRYGIPIRGITLFIFGGVAEMEEEPSSARGELLMAAAGPAASLVLGAALLAAASATAPPPAAAVLGYLGFINWVLALFNLVPAFPLDGGRMLRAALWLWRGDLLQATRIAATCGRGFGLLLVVFGLFRVLNGDVVGGAWSFLIGMFLRAAAIESYRHTLAGRLLAGVTVGQIMTPDPVAVPADIPVARFVDEYVYRHHHHWFPVVRDGALLGTVGTREIATVDRANWARVPLAGLLKPIAADMLASPNTEAMEALRRLRRGGQERLLVLQDNELVGVLALRDVLGALAVREELVPP